MLKSVPALSEYDDGSGLCRYLDHTLCAIYDTRPLICDVEAVYTAFFKTAMTEKDFFTANLQACQAIAERFQNSEALQAITKALTEIF